MASGRTGPSQTYGVPHPPAYQKQLSDRAEQQEADRIVGQRLTLQALEEKYRHLPLLPPQLPRPLYSIQGAPGFQKDAASAAFYLACSRGDMGVVQEHVQRFQPTPSDLAYALEEACQNFQLDVVQFLLQQPDIELHYRCFRRCMECPDDDLALEFGRGRSCGGSQSIFTSGDSRLLGLLKILIDYGWHPNQLLGPPIKGRRNPLILACQDVALHYPRCLLDLDILRVLLDAGADPTIGREIYGIYWFRSLAETPVRRMSADILERAVNLGANEAVTLLISRGAKPDYGIPLHSLARRQSDCLKTKIMSDTFVTELGQQSPELQYPTLSTRLTMAGHLLRHGADINKIADVYLLIGRYCRVPTRQHMATALTHAKDCLDWVYVRWLLENGADPGVAPPRTFPSECIYSVGAKQDEVERAFQGSVEEANPGEGSHIAQDNPVTNRQAPLKVSNRSQPI